MSVRVILRAAIPADEEIAIADPLAPNRVAGKVYIYPIDNGWEVSGHYRRNLADRWHPFLMTLGANQQLVSLEVRDNDARLVAAAEMDPRVSATE